MSRKEGVTLKRSRMETDDITQALRSTENAIRDYVALVLSRVHGSDWENKLGVAPAKLDGWRARREAEIRRSPAADSRLLFYADFGDLPAILEPNWSHLESGLGDKARFMAALGELRSLRNTEAHGRGFFLHEKLLILGFSGRIRTTIAMARSKIDSLEEHFARLESVRDSLGFTRVPKGPAPARRIIRVGDTIEFTVSAIDPKNDQLEYGYSWRTTPQWSLDHTFNVEVLPEYVGKLSLLKIGIRTPRTPVGTWFEDCWEYQFSVLPNV